MAKQKKKRNKAYHGHDAAASTTPVIHRYEAVERSRFGQWVADHKLRLRIAGILAAVAGGIALLVGAITSALQ